MFFLPVFPTVAIDISEGLDFLRSSGVVPRDFKTRECLSKGRTIHAAN